MIPETHLDLFEKTVYATLTTLMPDGQPQSSVIWVSYDDGEIHINSTKGRQKDRNMRRDPRVTLLLLDPADPYRWIEIRGQVENITEEGAVDHIDQLAKKYEGVDHFYGGYTAAERQHTETRVKYTIRPLRVIAYPAKR
ncbi:MAG: PPOX class F420-dependent oxidoreductase [Anaerolineae bacterium]|nr:PPOX class F420-dependent oxidoreductase [Anaerolineae bacterium]